MKIESGRFTNLKVEERICELCKNGVEDEAHFILHCPVYDGLRNKIGSSLNNSILTEDGEKLEKLCKENTRNIVKFIAAAYDLRKSLIFVEK